MKSPRIELFRWLDRLQPSGPAVWSAAALAVGLSAGVGIWFFKLMIEWIHGAVFESLGSQIQFLGRWYVILFPVLGGLAVGLITHRLVGYERHHGVAGVMEAVALAGGRLRYRRMPFKALAASISIGTGASVGPEDPSVQIGANLGSMVGQWLRLSDERVRALVASGAAAGIAAAFNAPISGVFFALEIIVGELAAGTLGMVLVTAVVSAVFTQAVSGVQPAFHVPEYAFNSALELPFYLGLGLLAGPISAIYIRLLYLFQDFFHRLSLPGWIKPALAGVGVGVVGIFIPQVFGVGYQTIESILNGTQLGLLFLVALLVAKLILTPLSIGGGFQGGVFAPALFLGAVLGGAYGTLVESLFPGLAIHPAAFAMVGMAAVLAGTVHAPLTAILLLFEMTRDYRIILPLMFAVAISLLVSQWLQKDSVYLLGLLRKGIRLERGKDVDVLEALQVDEVMREKIEALKEDDPLALAQEVLVQTRHHGLPVLNAGGELVGILTIQDVDRAFQEDRMQIRVGEACTHVLVTAYPDESIGTALRRMSTRDIGRLPVVRRDNPRQMVGWLRRADLARAYDLALTRRAALRHSAHQVRLGALQEEETNIFEIKVADGAAIVGQSLREIAWPQACLVASLRRGRHILVPRGDTVILAGDVLVVVAESETLPDVEALCTPGGKAS